MKYIILLIIFIYLIIIINCSYNPISIGSIIVSTTHMIYVLQPKEYGGTDKSTIIFTATKNMTIINTIFDLTSRDLYILFTNTTDNYIYISKLISVEKLSSIIYQLPISFNASYINQFTSFTSDPKNRRVFFTDQTGNVTIFSMSGIMKTILKIPSTISNPIRSVGYNQDLNRLFIITDTTVHSCTGLDKNQLECCEALPKMDQLRSITFDLLTIKSYVYIMDERSGIYRVILNNIGCPVSISPINTVGIYSNIHLVIDKDLYVCSGSIDSLKHNSILIIGNITQTPRSIPFETSIVALHMAYPSLKSLIEHDETCFHGLTYHSYRVAAILAAIFGTIMGIFMCFNALFCIDFFMTKRIIRDLKKQIPHNLLEDRWNKLVEEKYAKLALEIHRKKNDPTPKRKSSIGIRKETAINDNNQNNTEKSQISNPISKISAYVRRKSESYLSSRRSEDYRNLRQINATRLAAQNNPISSTQIEIEENDNSKKRGETSSQYNLLKTEGELL